LILFGGKGGVGKTTMAAASALYLAESREDEQKVLVISTDPAHSLSDAFGVEIGDRVTAIQRSEVGGQRAEVGSKESESGGGRAAVTAKTQMECSQSKIQIPKSKFQNLFARELDAGRLLEAFKQKNRDVIQKLAERGTYFDQEDVAGFLDLSLPGMDEVMAIMEIAGLLREGFYDLIIVDTAPTGHTLRMLNLPEQMLKWIEALDLMQRKHRYLSEIFSRKRYRGDACDRFLEDLSSDIDRVRRLLSDEETTRFVPVLIPEQMSTSETERLIRSLEPMGVPVREMIVNHVAKSSACAFCRARREHQEGPLKEIGKRFPDFRRIEVPEFPREIRGIGGLRIIANALCGMPAALDPHKRVQASDAPSDCLRLDTGLEFVLIGGKGGVGKTTVASATALHLAQRHPGKRVLLFSTDPAHSLSDSLDQPIGDEIIPVQWSRVSGQKSELRGQTEVEANPIQIQNRTVHDHRTTVNDGRRPNGMSVQRSASKVQSQMTHDQYPMTHLYALEIDAERLWRDFKETFRSDIEVLFDRFVGRGADIRFDREAMSEMIELAPPGVDEIMALNRIMDLRNEGAFDIFVLDTSPTGHLLRFLEMPDLARKWLKTFFGLLLKYKGVVRLAGAAEKALSLARNVRRIQETLIDAQRTGFIATTIPESMAIAELERLMRALESGNIPCRHIVVNKAVPNTDCGFCSIRRAEQQDIVRRIASRFPDRTIVQAPLFPRPIDGPIDLMQFRNALFCQTPEGVSPQGLLTARSEQ